MDTGWGRRITALLAMVAVCAATRAIAQEPPAAGDGFGQRDGNFAPGKPGQGAPGFPGGGQNGFQPPQGFPGGPPPFGANPVPELAKKTMTIMALRVIVQSGFTAKEIQAVLPPLRDLREAEKVFKKRAEQLLDEERTALLAAPPGGPMPPNSGQRMQEAMQMFQERSQHAWSDVEDALGASRRQEGLDKANLLRALTQGFPNPGMQPNAVGFEGQGFLNPGRGFGRPGAGPNPGGPGGPFPPQAGQQGAPAGRGGRNPGRNAGPPPTEAEGGDGVPVQAPEPVLAAPPQAGGEAPAIAGPFAPGAQGQPGQPGQPGQQPVPPRGQGRPGFRGQNRGGFAPGGQPAPAQNQPFMGFGPHVTITELVELLEQRLAAMPK